MRKEQMDSREDKVEEEKKAEVQILEREITLSLINEKLNYILEQLANK